MESRYMQIKKQMEAREEAMKPKTLKQVVSDKEGFKKDMAKFYGVNPGMTRDVDLNQFVGQKGKENSEGQSANGNRPFTVPVEGATRKHIYS